MVPYWDMDPNPQANIPLENMIVAMFAPRAESTTKADDPQRLEAIMQEWRVLRM
jgi:hypothetical protein